MLHDYFREFDENEFLPEDEREYEDFEFPWDSSDWYPPEDFNEAELPF